MIATAAIRKATPKSPSAEKTCTGHVSDEVQLNLRNDLAVARQKAGDGKGCLSALADVVRYTEPKLIARSILFNRALCGSDCDNKRPGCLEGKAARGRKASVGPPR